MSPRREVQRPTEAQVAAADPAVSAWVGANAGSGKTRVLTQRVARLLLGGVEPERILCLTYTRAAAAEMQNRLYETLGGWAMAPDGRLGAELAAISGQEAPITQAGRLARARRLFAR
ncbi:MAG: UvrD-helicase domain-containing protein, partial [Paracoccaceae bacterium]